MRHWPVLPHAPRKPGRLHVPRGLGMSSVPFTVEFVEPVTPLPQLDKEFLNYVANLTRDKYADPQ
ncbi:hypothetical protein HDU93_003472, partial [Gonapodya sp. JEL0774]